LLAEAVAAVVVMAGASAAGDSMAVGAFMVAASVAVDFMAAVSLAEDFTALDFVAAVSPAEGFTAVDFTEIGFTTATSTIGPSSLEVTRSFTIPIHTMAMIPTITILTAIIRMAMDMVIILTAMDTVAFAASILGGMGFIAAAVFTAVAFMPVALTAMGPAAVDDSYNETVYRDIAVYAEAKVSS
jgi:hypothetical protein